MKTVDDKIIVSIIIPVYNEERYIKECLDSLVAQSYPTESTEIIIVDGCSTDKTVELCESYISKANICIMTNSMKRTTYALNIGIDKAKGKYIIRMDAHAKYASDYVEKCVFYLDTKDIDNVGGVAETRGKGVIGNAIAHMLSSKFGVGGSAFRTNGKSGYVDTVPFGAFRKDVFDRIGLFNHKLPRSEDNDINARIRAAGGKIWLANDIRFIYYCRDSLNGILKMAIQNGNALFRTIKENPTAMSIRHFVPFTFFLSLIVLPVLSLLWHGAKVLLGVELFLYIALDAYFSFRKDNRQCALILIWMFPVFHFVYGLGSFLGLIGVKLYK